MTDTTNDECTPERSAEIRRLNDALRVNLTGGKVMMTRGIRALGFEGQARVLAAVRAFKDFNGDNDPWGEHDMAALDVVIDGMPERIFFKVDYYDPTMTQHSDDPADPAKTMRVLTIMLASEY